nr:uncharacterized protein LOC109155335 [Ipomoea batatas]
MGYVNGSISPPPATLLVAVEGTRAILTVTIPNPYFELKEQLHNIQKGGDSIKKYLDSVVKIVAALDRAKFAILEQDVILCVLRGLPSEYSSIKQNIRTNIATVIVAQVSSWLVTEELTLQMEQRIQLPLDYWHHFDSEYNGPSISTPQAFYASQSTNSNGNWFLNTCANAHVTPDLSRLYSHPPYSGTETVTSAGGHPLPIAHVGSEMSRNSKPQWRSPGSVASQRAKEPRTNSAPEQAEEQAQQPVDQQQAEPIQSPEPNDNTEQESEDESEEDGLGQSSDDELHIRSLPTRITKNVVRLNSAQQQCVREMGMGNLLDLNITNLPRRLGLWLVENFDPRSCTLQLQNGQSIHITAADVAATLGLPMGQIEITRRAARMLETEAGDPWFKRHFALLVITVLIDPMVNGYVNQNYIDHLQDVDNIPNLNWCQMVINSLVFYADRVVLYRRTVPRSYPAFRSWTFKLLSKREQAEIKSGGFGFGHIDSALELGNAPPKEAGPSIPQADVPPQPEPREQNPRLPEGLEDFVDEITSTTRTIATALLRISTLVETAPSAILENERFKKMFESAGQVLGFKAQEEHDLTFSQEEDAYWGNLDVLNSVDEIVRAIQKRTYLNDVPSFSLGLTQEEQNHGWDDVNAVAREYGDGEQRQERDAVEVNVDGGEAEVGEEIPRAAERPKEIRTEIPAPSDEVTSDQAPPGSSSEPPPEIQAKDKGKRPVLEYSPLRPRQPLPIIDINAPINATEEAVRKWVLENPNPDVSQELFKFQSRVILWEDMLLLKPNSEIPTSIIDAWAAILNNNEEDRLSSRFFASTWTTLYTVVDPLSEEDERFMKFSDNYLVDKTFAVETQWKNIQHFLFPIIASQHYYMIHFDPLCERFEAIDNSSKVCKTDDKYGIVPTTLQKFLSMFMTGLKSTYKFEKIAKFVENKENEDVLEG